MSEAKRLADARERERMQGDPIARRDHQLAEYRGNIDALKEELEIARQRAASAESFAAEYREKWQEIEAARRDRETLDDTRRELDDLRGRYAELLEIVRTKSEIPVDRLIKYVRAAPYKTWGVKGITERQLLRHKIAAERDRDEAYNLAADLLNQRDDLQAKIDALLGGRK